VRRTPARRGIRAAVATTLVAGLPIVAVMVGAPPAAAAAPPAPGRLAYVGEHHDELAYAVDGAQTPLFPNEAGPTPVDYDASADPNGGLTWVSTRDDRRGDIYYLAPGSEAPIRLAANAATDRQPALSLDGTTVAFVSDRGGVTQIWAVNTDGTNLRQITTVPPAIPPGAPRAVDSGPTWSPDGTRLAFSSTRHNLNGDLYTTTVNPPQVTPVRITVSTGANGAIQPAWDPVADHNRIAFTRTSGPTNPTRLLSIPPNGAGTTTQLVPLWDASQASWNAEGNTIAFTSRRLNPDGGIYVKTVDDIGGGSPEPELVYDDNRNPEANATWYYVPESPPLVVFTHAAADEPGEIRDVQLPDGTNDRDLSFRPNRFESAPAYSPDGRKVAYSRRNGTVNDIVTINADATTVTPTVLTRPRAPERDVDPVYSPDGTKLAFVRSNRIIVINVNTGAELFRVPPPPPTTPNNGFVDGEPTWSADGQRIMFARYTVPVAAPPIPLARALAANPLDGLDTDVWSVRASDGGDQLNLTGADDTPAISFDRQPRLAPNGQALVVNRNGRLRLIPLANNQPTGTPRDLAIVTPPNDPISGVQYPAWAPDSKSIAFSAIRGPSNTRDIGAITVPATGDGVLSWLTTSIGNENQPVYQPTSDLEVTVAPSDPEILVGETTTLTVTVTNLGQAGARKVKGTLALQTGLTATSITTTTPGATCSLATVSCDLTGPLPAEGTLVFNVVAFGQTAGTYTPTATVSGSILDLGTANNTATTTVIVTTIPDVDFRDVGVAMATTPATGFKGGDPVVATYTVLNRGEAPATGVTLTTDLPGTLGRGTVTGCTLTGVSCELGQLAPGQTAKVSIALSPDAKVTAAVSGTIKARFAQGTDENAANDKATGTIKVLQPTITVIPAVGPPGSVARVTGKEFPPGVAINLTWDKGINPASRKFTVRPDGTFDGQALVFRRDQLGARFLAASGLRFGAVQDDFLVVPRTFSPPDFVSRG
jgi:uncharacterized repeat protein (TIGR01451 family)